MSLNGGLRLSRKPARPFIFALFTSHIDYFRHLIIDDVNNLNVNQGIAAWKPLIRPLSWLCIMLSALFTPDSPGRLVFRTDLTCRPFAGP
jgi:hypothetical protein